MLYAPAYVAIAKGYFDELGLDVARDRARRRQVRGDHAVQPGRYRAHRPGSAIYVQNGESPVKIRSSAGSPRPTAHAGRTREGRQVRLEHAQGQGDLDSDPAARRCSSGGALRKNGLDPQKDVKLMNNVGIPARVGSWLAGQSQYAIFIDLMPRSSSSTARRISWPRSAKPWDLPTTPPSWHRQIRRREQGDATELDQRSPRA